MRLSEDGPLVTQAAYVAEQTRAQAARWQWVREAWHDDRAPIWMRGTPAPERYTVQAETTLAAFRRLGKVTLEEQRW